MVSTMLPTSNRFRIDFKYNPTVLKHELNYYPFHSYSFLIKTSWDNCKIGLIHPFPFAIWWYKFLLCSHIHDWNELSVNCNMVSLISPHNYQIIFNSFSYMIQFFTLLLQCEHKTNYKHMMRYNSLCQLEIPVRLYKINGLCEASWKSQTSMCVLQKSNRAKPVSLSSEMRLQYIFPGGHRRPWNHSL